MAVPKRKQSKSRSAIRRAQVMKQPVPQFIPCPRCGEPQLSHRVCAPAATTRTGWSSREGRGDAPEPDAASPSTRWGRTPRPASRSRASSRPCARPDLEVVLVGDEAARSRGRWRAGGAARAATGIDVRHAPEVITMDDAPAMAVKQKKHSSMRVCFDLAKAGEVDAVVSAGNSGAMMACGLFVLGRLAGRRAARRSSPPSRRRRGQCALLDMGANVDPRPTVLAQFAVLGSVYARLRHGKARPQVGLLSNGAEEHKGTAAHPRDAPAAGRGAGRRRRRASSTTSATSRAGTSSAARSTSSSPTASPATSAQGRSRGWPRRSSRWCARRCVRGGAAARSWARC